MVNNSSNANGAGFIGKEILAAGSASPVDPAELFPSLQYGLDPLVEARLADIVGRLRAAWILHLADFWTDIHLVDVDSSSDLEKRVSTALRKGFLHFSQLLCGLELLLRERVDLGAETVERLLSIEKLLVELGNDRSNLIEVAKSDRCLAEFPGGGNGADCG